MKKNVILRAPLLTLSGYGVHSRQVFRWLESRSDEYNTSVQTVPWGNTSWIIDENRFDGLIGRIMMKTAPNQGGQYDISIQIQLPNEWDPNLARFNVGITAAVETDICNPSWINNINSMDLVIVPSEHIKNVILNSGNVQTRLEVVPESFIDEIMEKELDISLPEFSTPFNFLIFGQITGRSDETDRKNTYKTLKWLCDSFKNDKDVGIVIKTNSARNNQFDRAGTKDLLKKTLGQVRGKNKLPPVHFVHGEMSNKEIAALYRHPQIKALVSLTRGEGYGLPLLEAAASGLPVIATNWSGHLDFLSKGKFLDIDYDLKTIPESRQDRRKCGQCNGSGKIGPMVICPACGGTGFTQIFMPDAKWAEPKETSAKKILKKFRNLPEKPQEWAKDLKEKICKEYSQEAIAKHYDRVFSDIAIW